MENKYLVNFKASFNNNSPAGIGLTTTIPWDGKDSDELKQKLKQKIIDNITITLYSVMEIGGQSGQEGQ